jgi:hypothetical protein
MALGCAHIFKTVANNETEDVLPSGQISHLKNIDTEFAAVFIISDSTSFTQELPLAIILYGEGSFLRS